MYFEREKNDKSSAYYEKAWENISILKWNKSEVKNLVFQAVSNKKGYLYVEKETGIPWEIVAGIHMRESSFSFDCNLHNGQPLDQVTTKVPKGKGPFETWEESVIDALNLKRRLIPRLWTISKIGRFVEAYNGYGYAMRGKHSPYLWSFSNFGVFAGKFSEDGIYRETLTDKQCGVLTLIKGMIESKKSNLLNPVKSTFKIYRPSFDENLRHFGVLIQYNPNKKSNLVKNYQCYLNSLIEKIGRENVKIKEDGYAGPKTSNLMKALLGSYLFGDPRN